MDKLIDCFVQTFAIDRGRIVPSLAYQSIPEWDSVAHMALITEIENQFDVTLDTDDIIAMSSVEKAIEILRKAGVTID